MLCRVRELFSADLGMGVLALPLLRDITPINVTQTHTWILLLRMHVHDSIILWASRKLSWEAHAQPEQEARTS